MADGTSAGAEGSPIRRGETPETMAIGIDRAIPLEAAKRILAINTDPETPIMDKATYAVIGDLHAVVPAVCAEIRRARDR